MNASEEIVGIYGGMLMELYIMMTRGVHIHEPNQTGTIFMVWFKKPVYSVNPVQYRTGFLSKPGSESVFYLNPVFCHELVFSGLKLGLIQTSAAMHSTLFHRFLIQFY